MADLPARGESDQREREPAASDATATEAVDLTATELRVLFEASPDGIVVVGEDGQIRAVNAKVERLFGYSRSDLIGKAVELLVPAASRPAHRQERSAFAARPRSRPMGSGLELYGRRGDGSEFPVEISLSPAFTERGLVIIATVRDMTERRRVRAFGAQALRATEEERKRVARELHDETLQTLAAILIRLRVAQRGPDVLSVQELLEELRLEIAEAADGVRRIARDLRPPALDELGIVAAIQEHARSLRETAGLAIEVEADPLDDALTDEAQLVLYRIVQEALSNTVRHAYASRAWVRLRRQGNLVVAEVKDDGTGFSVGELMTRDERGLGLFGMTERASYVRGRVIIDSRPGEGTTIRAEIPVREGGAVG
ncbi:MAG: PAS domain-containing sensor histidine kinase [Gemmatimonadota bacterium]